MVELTTYELAMVEVHCGRGSIAYRFEDGVLAVFLGDQIALAEGCQQVEISPACTMWAMSFNPPLRPALSATEAKVWEQAAELLWPADKAKPDGPEWFGNCEDYAREWSDDRDYRQAQEFRAKAVALRGAAEDSRTSEAETAWAIERIERSKAIHLAWVDHLRAHQSSGVICDRCPPDIGHSVGDVEHHLSVAADYDRVLGVLRSRYAPTKAGGPERAPPAPDRAAPPA